MSIIRPLTALFVASLSSCVIFNIDGGDGGEECASLDEVCPNLACPFGNVVVDGCAICECANSCDPGPQPECANAVVIGCEWVCGTACFGDFDCLSGQTCSFGDAVPLPAPSEDDRAAPAGVCVEVERRCTFDGDCGQGFFCDLNGGGSEPDAGGAPPPDGGDGDAPQEDPAPVPPLPEGVCRPSAQCFSDDDCGVGQVCEQPDFTNGLVAPGGVCVNKTSECNDNDDCGEGLVCATECAPIPGCPECDACIFIGTCVVPEVACFSGEECQRGEFCDFAGVARPCFDDNRDGQCDDASDFIAPQGVCRPLVTECGSDDACPEGQVCEFADDCVCDTACEDDGNGGCLPCECVPTGARSSGVCVDDPNLNPCATVRCAGGTTCVALPDGSAQCVEDDNRCFSNAECAQDQRCNANDVCLSPPGCEEGQDCLAVCAGFCVDVDRVCSIDDDCADDEFCLTDRFSDPGDCIVPDCANRPAPAPEGVCRPREQANPCAAVLCVEGTACEVVGGEAVCKATIGECVSTNDCPMGSVCNAGEAVCNSPACERNEVCIDVCSGYCVAQP